MDRSRFQRVKDLFGQALPLAAPARAALLDRECAHDPVLRGEVEDLLAHADRASTGFLDQPRATVPVAGPPVAIDGYELHEPIATGSSGVVYRAVQLAPRRTVAIKVLRVDALAPGSLARFARESQIVGSLRHPGIAQVHGAGVARSGSLELPWIAMELVDGRPLDEHVKDLRGDPRAVLDLFVRICAPIEHAHRLGIVHRDIKPSNVLVEADGRPRIVDFGVARVLGEGAGAARTRTGSLVGTLAYMAPEQARGERDAIDARADVYALGVLLFEMLTGRLPIEVDRGDVLESVRAVCEDEPERPSHARPGLPRDLDAVVARALEKDRARRYPDAGALARDVENVLAHRPIEARRATAIDQARKFVRRNRVLALSSAAVITALLAGLAMALAALHEARVERERTSDTLDFLAGRMTALAPRLGFGEEQRGDLEEIARRIERQLEFDARSRPLRVALSQTLYELVTLAQARRDFVAQRALAERALLLREELAREDPADIDSRSRSSDLCAKLGEAARDLGDLPGRDAWFARALAIDEALVAARPDDAELVEDLGWSLARVAQVAGDRGDLDEAERLQLRRIADARRVGSATSSNARLVYNLSHACYFVAGLHEKRGRIAAAVEPAEESARLARRLTELEPDRRDFVLWHANALRGTASVLRQSGDIDRATMLTAEALAAAEELAVSDPHRADHVECLRNAAHELATTEPPAAPLVLRQCAESLGRAVSAADRAGARQAADSLRSALADLQRRSGSD